MKKTYKNRLNFSIVRVGGHYRIQCDETLELVSGKISSRKVIEGLLKDHISTDKFKEASKTFTKEEISKRVKLFNGRLRPKKKPWTIEEAKLVASIYTSRGQLYTQNPKLYSSAYAKNWLNEICAHMTPSRKKNKFTYGVLNPNTALAKIFDYKTHHEFAIANQGAYDALRRFGVDTLELFDNRDNAEYLKETIKKLASESVERLTT